MNNSVKTALVTGANRGLGYETARQLAGRGYHLIATARDPDKGEQASRRIGEETGQEVEFLRLDVSDSASIRAVGTSLEERGCRIDLLVNNAGVAIDGFNEEIARRTIDTNFYGPMRLTEELLPLMPQGATIVMVSSGAGELSILSEELKERFTEPALTRRSLGELVESFVNAVAAGRHGEEGWPSYAYGVSKAALNAYVRLLAPELADRHIRVNAVCPGWVRTDMGGSSATRSLEEGTSSILWAALLDEERTGGFYRDGKAIAW